MLYFIHIHISYFSYFKHIYTGYKFNKYIVLQFGPVKGQIVFRISLLWHCSTFFLNFSAICSVEFWALIKCNSFKSFA